MLTRWQTLPRKIILKHVKAVLSKFDKRCLLIVLLIVLKLNCYFNKWFFPSVLDPLLDERKNSISHILQFLLFILSVQPCWPHVYYANICIWEQLKCMMEEQTNESPSSEKNQGWTWFLRTRGALRQPQYQLRH